MKRVVWVSMIVVLGLSGQSALAQPAPEHTWGVCIGIGAYDDLNLTLKWSDTDASEFCKTFLKFTLRVPEDHYRIVKNEDATHEGIIDAFGWVAMRAKPGDRVYLFYSGHGSEAELFVPYDSTYPLTLDEVRGVLSKIDAEVLVFTDACLSGRLVGKRVKAATAKGGGGWPKDVTVKLAQVAKPAAASGTAPGVVIMTSSNGQQDSLEISWLKNSLFTYHLMDALMNPAQADANHDGRVTMLELFQAVAPRVTAGAQAADAKAPQNPQTPQISDEQAAQKVIVLTYRSDGPTPAPTKTPTPEPTPDPSQEGKPTLLPSSEGPGVGLPPENPEAGEVWYDAVADMNFVWAPAGAFQMGSPDNENGRDGDEGPVHRVKLDGFWIGQTEVTQAQWERIMGNNPSKFEGDNNPVEQVSWEDAQVFLKKLNARTPPPAPPQQGGGRGTPSPKLGEGWGGVYRLPTEAEWEYACRAGTQTAYSFGNDANKLGEYAWYSANSDSETHPVGQKQANPWNLYDMHGNVYEWCQDWKGAYSATPQTNPQGPKTGDARLLRGGAWSFDSRADLRCANRYAVIASARYIDYGLRVARGR